MKEALWWRTEEDGRILCTLCPRFCRMGDGQAGFCYIRKNIGGKLYSLGYGTSTGFAIDPIEKKPLNHFLPGTGILSFGTAGCNLGCRFCQNWSISKAKLDEAHSLNAGPERVVQLAERYKVPSIAFTYNDPVIWGEFVVDISRLARERDLKSVMVTAGYITPEARPEVFRYIDAANVDLKAFTERFYHKVTFSHLDPVLDTLRWLKHETDIWFEITNLMIPGENDEADETRRLCKARRHAVRAAIMSLSGARGMTFWNTIWTATAVRAEKRSRAFSPPAIHAASSDKEDFIHRSFRAATARSLAKSPNLCFIKKSAP